MTPQLMDHPVIATPLEGQSVLISPAAPAPASAESTSADPSSPIRAGAYAQTWQQGAMVGLVGVSMLILLTVGVVTAFSVLSASLLTVDAVVVVGLVGLTGVLLALLYRSQRQGTPSEKK